MTLSDAQLESIATPEVSYWLNMVRLGDLTASKELIRAVVAALPMTGVSPAPREPDTLRDLLDRAASFADSKGNDELSGALHEASMRLTSAPREEPSK